MLLNITVVLKGINNYNMRYVHLAKLFITIAVFLSSCLFQDKQNEKQKVSVSESVEQHIEADTLLPANHYHSVISRVDQLNLPILNEGFDSLQTRIWYEHSLSYQKSVLILSYTFEKWKGEVIHYQINEGIGKEAMIMSYKKQRVQPKSGWPHLISKLYSLNIDKNIGDGRHGADGPVYNVEVATKSSYLFYDYLNFRGYENIKETFSDFEKIIYLISKEFPKLDFLIR